jgi:prolyl oligopeptidase
LKALVAASVLLLSSAVAAAGKPPAIATRKDAVVEKLHGVDVADPYRWLEDGDAPEVQRWTEAQNAATRAALDKVPGRAALEKRLWELYEIGSLGIPVSRPLSKGAPVARRYFYTRRDGKQNQAVLYVRDGADGADRSLVDVNAARADGTRALDWWYPSDDGARVAYGVSDDGSEESVLRVRDVATGRDSDEIPRARACSLSWAPDGRGFYYTRYPAPGEAPADELKYHRGVFFHRLGDDPAHDAKLFGEGRDKTDWPNIELSPAGRWLAITVSQGWSKSEIHLLDTRAGAKAKPVVVAAGEEARFWVVEALDDRLFVFTTSGAPRGRVFVVDPAHPARERWREIVKQGDDVLESVTYFKGGLAASYLHDAAARLRLFGEDGADRGEIPLPSLGTITGLSGARDTTELFYGFTSFFVPTAIYRATDGGTPALWRRLEAKIDPAAFEVERVTVTSRDGSKAPLFLAHKKGAPRDGSRPAVLTGYGGFDHSILPAWSPAAIPFLEHGGTFALAVLRGGGEYGESWHHAGMLGQKQNVFDDFIAAARWLVDNRVTSASRLGISGRSNGGLLVGAALTQAPELYRAVVCGVPLLDMLRYHRFRIAALWAPEYGSPDDPEAFRWLRAYSPYHNVRDGVRYPAVFFYTAASDTRVDPMHARKMTARLQAANAGPHPIRLWLESRAGHGAGKPLAKVIAQTTDEWSFLFSELGVTKRK